MPEMYLIGAVLKSYSQLLSRQVRNLPLTASHLLLANSHHHTLVFLQKVPSTLTHRYPILLRHPTLLNSPIPVLHRPSIHCLLLGKFNPSQLPPPLASPTFASVLGSRTVQSQSALAMQNDGADLTVVDIDRKEKRTVSTERHKSKQQAQ